MSLTVRLAPRRHIQSGNTLSAYTLTIAGRAVSTAKTFDVVNPADGTIVAACPDATTVDGLKEYTTVQVLNVAH